MCVCARACLFWQTSTKDDLRGSWTGFREGRDPGFGSPLVSMFTKVQRCEIKVTVSIHTHVYGMFLCCVLHTNSHTDLPVEELCSEMCLRGDAFPLRG